MINSRIKRLFQVVGKIHENNLYLKEILKAQVFQSVITDSKWVKFKGFSPGGWAVDFGMLYTLFRILNDVKPARVLEFGLGQSSKLIYQYIDFFKGSFAITIEHDENWVKFFKQGLEVDYSINVSLSKLKKQFYKGKETLVYEDMEKTLGEQRFNLVVVDAPFGSDHYSRSQVLDLIPANLDKSFCIIIDDYNRVGERQTFREVCKLLDVNSFKYVTKVYRSFKEHAIICSPDLFFLTTM